MFWYKSEMIKITHGFFNGAIVHEEDVATLDELINKRANEGWMLVTYSFMTDLKGLENEQLLITFRREQGKYIPALHNANRE